MSDSPSTPAISASVLRAQLKRGLSRLQFSQPLEAQFVQYLRQTEARPALCTLVLGILVWWFYTGLDIWRLHQLGTSTDTDELFWRSFIPRFGVHLCLLCSLYSVLQPARHLREYEWCMSGTMLALCLVITTSSYTLKNINMHETSVIMVLMMSVAFFPLGVRVRVMAPMALYIASCFTIAGPLLLRQPDAMREHWVLVAVVWGAFMLSGLMAYYREKVLREQFVLRQLLDWEACHDPLTGLANRRRFHEHLATARGQAQREGDQLFLVIIDIDHFKLYNDHYGHSAGDRVLQTVAQRLYHYAQRPLDLAVRLGGEEFALILYGTHEAGVRKHLRQLQEDLRLDPMEHNASPTAPYVTVSMGATQVLPQDTADQTFQRADALLYEAKHLGRNRVMLKTPSE